MSYKLKKSPKSCNGTMPACLAIENVQKYASLGGFTISKIHEHDIYDTKMPTNLAGEKLCCVFLPGCCIFFSLGEEN